MPIEGNAPALKAVVIALHPRLNAIVLNIGSLDGVKVGHGFVIHRGTEYVAKVVVEAVQEETCFGASMKEFQAKTIQVGDGARTR